MVYLLNRNRIWLSVSLVVFVIAACSATSVLQADNDLVFEEDQAQNNIFDDPYSAEHSPSGLLSYVHGSLKRITRSLWSFLDSDDTTTSSTDSTSSSNPDTILTRVTRSTEDDADSTLPMQPGGGPKRGDTSIEDDEDDRHTSGDGYGSGDGPDLDESSHIVPEAPEKEHSNSIDGYLPDNDVRKVFYQLGNANKNTTASAASASTTTASPQPSEPQTLSPAVVEYGTSGPAPEFENGVQAPATNFRVHLTIMEPYVKDYVDMNSEAFKWLANNITLSLNDFLKQYGTYTPRVVAIQPSSTDKFFVRATVDIESEGRESVDTLENHLKYFISNFRTSNPNSPLTIVDKGFDISTASIGNTAICQSGETLCVVTNACLPPEAQCDGSIDCPDNTDELMCPSTPRPLVPDICQSNEFQCDGVRCIQGTDVCNGIIDCSDQTDEQNCRPTTAAKVCDPAISFSCRSTNQCIDVNKKCDTRVDCNDGSDEEDCENCGSDEFRCHDGQCLTIDKRCNGVAECSGKEDEDNCQGQTYDSDTSFIAPCPNSDFTCHVDMSCISLSKSCDGRSDCPDAEDERDCKNVVAGLTPPDSDTDDGAPQTTISSTVVSACFSNEFRCHDGSCVHLDFRCDRINDCLDHSDEWDCYGIVTTTTTFRPPVTTGVYRQQNATESPWFVTCNWNEFACRNRQQCVPKAAVCNNNYECKDYSDEDNCNATPDGLNLKTYPNEQTIKANREVVFQCRDEGPLRAPVKWVRGNGLYLPLGTRDIGGRLEMPNIQVEHSGTYVCEAVGFSVSDPGSRVSVYLNVEPWVDVNNRPIEACGYNEATCSNKQCIPKLKVCDGQVDCSDGSDETRCSMFGCQPNEFRCSNKKCILKTWKCDGQDDCGDNFDEQNCEPTPPGAHCLTSEFECRNKECIPKSFQCDSQSDCSDGSDEFGCLPVQFVTNPPALITLDVGSVFVTTCKAVGVPTPEISWRFNWGHVPTKCEMKSVDGFGTLTCPNVEESDKGAYSCEGINIHGSEIAVPDTILDIKRQSTPQVSCPRGTFNDIALSQNDCVNCFCFGISSTCRSSNLYQAQNKPPVQQLKLTSVFIEPSSLRAELVSGSSNSHRVNTNDNDALQFFAANNNDSRSSENTDYPYFKFPEKYLGNQLKSFGGYIKYTVRYEGNGDPIGFIPDIILIGNGVKLMYFAPQIPVGSDTVVSARLFAGIWQKEGSSSPSDQLATREEVMMVLANLENILIRGLYVSQQPETNLKQIKMDSAQTFNNDKEHVPFVEECQCPAGYSGLSCESCAPGYIRRQQGPWLGQCYREILETCPTGMYGDLSRGIPCKHCPCPLTSSGNQFGRSCYLDTDGSPTCNCFEGYVGRNCEKCAPGFSGNPLEAGSYCKRGVCDEVGSLSPYPDESTKKCICKESTTGDLCNQCKANTFNLSPDNQFGCTSCFCMGITNQCSSSRLYRHQIRATFARTNQYLDNIQLILRRDVNSLPNVNMDPDTKELVYSDFPPGSQEVYYWKLPRRFLGNRITAYGGSLSYTLRHVPVPGGQSSKNSAPDIELISDDKTRLLHYSREIVEPNTLKTISVKIMEQYWQRSDGQVATREHLLMALADLKYILIKATYTTGTKEVAIQSVSLDIADLPNTGQNRAVEVEECSCPEGYDGLSCENCAVGYTRHDGIGLYLGICEPCSCNGHSNHCDAETGTCFNCQNHTTGEECNKCLQGYKGNPAAGEPCVAYELTPSCDCDPRGTLLPCQDSNCICKTNVEGPRCDRCRPGTYDLSDNHIEGCLECYCSGVSQQCYASNLFVTQIPMQLFVSNHGFILTNRNRDKVIKSGFSTDVSRNEIGYDYTPNRGETLFWSLPPFFTGNKITSYGSFLNWTQRYTALPGSTIRDDIDIIIIGSGMSLYKSNNKIIRPNESTQQSVHLVEKGWRRLTLSAGQLPATRADFMKVLSSIEAILILAVHASQTDRTYLSDVSLDTTFETNTGDDRSVTVEVCRCPAGYKGTSCETCAIGYYKDVNDKCTRCPCNSHEESCSLGPDSRVTCYCNSGYTGPSCNTLASNLTLSNSSSVEPSGIILKLTPTADSIAKTEGAFVNFTCSYNSTIPLYIEMYVDYNDMAVHDSSNYSQYVSYVNFTGGAERVLLVKIREQLSRVMCNVINKDRFSIGQISTIIIPERDNLQTLPTTIRPLPPPEIFIQVSEPKIEIVEIGSSITLHCTANSRRSQRISLSWSKEFGYLPTNRAQDNGSGDLYLSNIEASDSGVYICMANDGYSSFTDKKVLKIADQSPTTRRPTQPEIIMSVFEPSVIEIVEVGSSLRLRCDARSRRNRPIQLKWTKEGGGSFPADRVIDNGSGYLMFRNADTSDSGVYVCTASDGYSAISEKKTLAVGGGKNVIKPKVVIKPKYLKLVVGQPAQFVCESPGAPTLEWSREVDLPFNPSYSSDDGIFRIQAVKQSDHGNYFCRATNENGEIDSQKVMIFIESSPNNESSDLLRLTVDPPQYSGPGDLVRLRCIISDDTQYESKWSKVNNQPLPYGSVQSDGLLTLNRLRPTDSGTYVCSAVSLRSGAIESQVEVPITISQRRNPPLLRIEPSKNIIPQGTSAELRCISNTDPNLQVQWFKSNGELSPNVEISGSYLRIPSAQVGDRGIYYCKATNEGGTGQASAIIDIERREAPVIDLHPSARQIVTLGGNVLFQCRVTGGIPTPVIKWTRRNGESLPSQVEEIPPGVIKILNIQASSAGEYVCEAKNSAGTTSATAILEIQSKPIIKLRPSTNVYTTLPGKQVRLYCQATGSPSPSVIWSKLTNSQTPYVIENSLSRQETSNKAEYVIDIAQPADSGYYSCIAQNSAGTTEERVQLIVSEDANEISGGENRGQDNKSNEDTNTIEPTRGDIPVSSDIGELIFNNDDVENMVGTRAELTCTAGPMAIRDRISITWGRGDQLRISDEYDIIENKLIIKNIQKKDQGSYICLGIAPDGTTVFNHTVRLIVVEPPRITLNPTRQIVKRGDNAQIMCTAEGDGPITITWSKLSSRSLPPSVQTNGGLLRFIGITEQEHGRYACKASNIYGDAESVAEVIVNDNSRDRPAPIIKAVDHNQEVMEGRNTTLRCMLPKSIEQYTVEWSRHRSSLSTNSEKKKNSLFLQNVHASDTDRYYCKVNSQYGTTIDYIDLNVILVCLNDEFRCDDGTCIFKAQYCDGKADCPDQSDEETSCLLNKNRIGRNSGLYIKPSQETIYIGEEFELECIWTSENPNEFSEISWAKLNADNIGSNVENRGPILKFNDVKTENSGTYQCTKLDRNNQIITEDYELIVTPNPSDAAYPSVSTKYAPYGKSVVIECNTDLSPPVEYSWAKFGPQMEPIYDRRNLTLYNMTEKSAGLYLCTASNEVIRIDIPTVLVVTGIVPSFSGTNSYLAFPTLPNNFLGFNIEVHFKPEMGDGLILYNGQKFGGTGDFFSFGLKNGIPEFRFDVGSGPAVIRASEPVTLNEWHTARLERSKKHGTMYVDERGPYEGFSPGTFQGMDLSQLLYIGGVPDFGVIHKDVGFQTGFVGCVSIFKTEIRTYNLMKDSVDKSGLGTCDVCSNNQCLNQGICQEAQSKEGYSCICQPGHGGEYCEKTREVCTPGICGLGDCVTGNEEIECKCKIGTIGKRCERSVEIVEPYFSSNSYLAYPTPTSQQNLTISLKINPSSLSDSVILYAAQNLQGIGQFMSLTLKNRQLEFRHTVAGVTSMLRSRHNLEIGEWATITINRNVETQETRLSVDKEPPIRSVENGNMLALEMKTHLFAGGYDSYKVKISKHVDVEGNFKGCIKMLKVSGMDVDMMSSAVDSSNVEDCATSRGDACSYNHCKNSINCHSSTKLYEYTCECEDGFSGPKCDVEAKLCPILKPCNNGGHCTDVDSNSYRCDCPLGHSGPTCDDKVVLDTTANFSRNSYLQLDNNKLLDKSKDKHSISMTFSTDSANGLLYWQGQEPKNEDMIENFIAVSIVNGYVELSHMFKGKATSNIRATDHHVNDNEPHSIVIRGNGLDWSLELDRKTTEYGKERDVDIRELLESTDLIYIGGLPQAIQRLSENSYKEYEGCIGDVRIQDSGYVNLYQNSLSGKNVASCNRPDFNNVVGKK